VEEKSVGENNEEYTHPDSFEEEMQSRVFDDEDVQSDSVSVLIEEPKKAEFEHNKGTLILATPLWFYLRGIIAIGLGVLMFLFQDEVVSFLGILLGCAIMVMSVLNIITGYKERFTAFYAKWLFVGGIIGLLLGCIIACVPLLVLEVVFLFLTFALVILGVNDIITAFYLRKMKGVRGSLCLLGLISIAAGVIIYMYPEILILLFCSYAVALGVLSIAVGLFMSAMNGKRRQENLT
jgi:uncharacterized membrane protein HdeD (DUF308 family)